MTAKEFENITEVLDVILSLNINQCSFTTHDLSTQECTRDAIVKGLAEHYGVDFQLHKHKQSRQDFPVSKRNM
jgi:hypothetical protein